MEWDSLIADLESRFDAERRAGIAAESTDLAEAEIASVRLVDRLRAAVGHEIHLLTIAGHRVDGRLMRVLEDVAMVDEGEGLQALVPIARVAAAHPLPGPAPSRGGGRAGLGAALRALARQGARVRLLLGVTEVTGRILRVAADHVDVMTDAEVVGVRRVTVALGAVEAVRSR